MSALTLSVDCVSRDEQQSGQQQATPEENFARNLKQLRELQDLSQDELASRMSAGGHQFHAATVYKIENGARRVQLTEAIELARILDTNPERMLDPPDEVENVEALHNEYSSFNESRQALESAARQYREERSWFAELINREGWPAALSYPVKALEKLDEMTLETWQDEASRTATEVVELIEFPFHIFGDEGIPDEAEITPEQALHIAVWEYQRAKSILGESLVRYGRAYRSLERLRANDPNFEDLIDRTTSNMNDVRESLGVVVDDPTALQLIELFKQHASESMPATGEHEDASNSAGD